MFNFAGKSSQGTTKGHTDVDFHGFWKGLDDSYFAHVAVTLLESKRKETLSKVHTFTQNHHHGTRADPRLDEEMLGHIRTQLLRHNTRSYSDLYFRDLNRQNSSPDPRPKSLGHPAAGARSENSNVLLGYKILEVRGEQSTRGKSELLLENEEQELTGRLERQKQLNHENIQWYPTRPLR